MPSASLFAQSDNGALPPEIKKKIEEVNKEIDIYVDEQIAQKKAEINADTRLNTEQKSIVLKSLPMIAAGNKAALHKAFEEFCIKAKCASDKISALGESYIMKDLALKMAEDQLEKLSRTQDKARENIDKVGTFINIAKGKIEDHVFGFWSGWGYSWFGIGAWEVFEGQGAIDILNKIRANLLQLDGRGTGIDYMRTMVANVQNIQQGLRDGTLTANEARIAFYEIHDNLIKIQARLKEIIRLANSATIKNAVDKINADAKKPKDKVDLPGIIAQLEMILNNDINSGLDFLASKDGAQIRERLYTALEVGKGLDMGKLLDDQLGVAINPKPPLAGANIFDPPDSPATIRGDIEPNPSPSITPPKPPISSNPSRPTGPSKTPFASGPMVVLGSYEYNPMTEKQETMPYLYFRTFEELKSFLTIPGTIVKKNVEINGVPRVMYYIQETPPKTPPRFNNR